MAAAAEFAENVWMHHPYDTAAIRKAAIQSFTQRVKRDLAKQLLEMRLFGSEARRDAQDDSDIDVPVVVQPEHERSQLEDCIIDIAFDVNVEFGVYISPRVLTAGILADPVWRETPFLKNVMRESIPL